MAISNNFLLKKRNPTTFVDFERAFVEVCTISLNSQKFTLYQMKHIFKTLFILLLAQQSYAQHVYQIRADSVRIYNVCDTAELIIENRTRGVSGFLYNKGNGVTEFRRIQLESVGNGQIAIIGQDTLDLSTLPGIGGIDTIYRSGNNIIYVKKGVQHTINLPAPANTWQDVMNNGNTSSITPVVKPSSGEGLKILHDDGFISGYTGNGFIRNGFLRFSNSSLNLYTERNIPMHFGTGNFTRLTITENGGVGINTFSPRGGGLDVNLRNAVFGEIPASIGYSSNGYPGIGYNVLHGATDDNDKRYIAASDNASYIKFQSGGFNFLTAPVGSAGSLIPFATRMVITEPGNVGIGTTTPSVKLDVNGAISSSSSIQASFFKGSTPVYSSGGYNLLVHNLTTNTYERTSTIPASMISGSISTTSSWQDVMSNGSSSNIRATITMDPLLNADLYGGGQYEARSSTYPSYGFHVPGVAGVALYLKPDESQTNLRLRTSSNLDYSLWHSGNDGAGSGLDADYVDGVSSERIVFGDGNAATANISGGNANNLAKSGFYDGNAISNAPTADWYNIIHSEHVSHGYSNQIAQKFTGSTNEVALFARTQYNSSWGPWRELWHTGNFNPANYAAASGNANYIQNQFSSAQNAEGWVSGRLRAGNIGAAGTIQMTPSDATHSGLLELYNGAGTRLGYIGYANDAMHYYDDVSSGHHFRGAAGGQYRIGGSIGPASLGGFKNFNGLALVGNYDENPTGQQIIWTIGDAWNSLSNFYGLGYSYVDAPGAMGNQHNIDIAEAGTVNHRFTMNGNYGLNGGIQAMSAVRARGNYNGYGEGAAAEMLQDGGHAYFTGYNRSTASYIPTHVDGSKILLSSTSEAIRTFQSNTGELTYGTWYLTGTRGNWTGLALPDAANTPTLMWDNASPSNGGIYYQGNGVWALYYNGSTNNLHIGSSSGNIAWHSGNVTFATAGANIALKTDADGYIVHDNWIRVADGKGLFTGNSKYFYSTPGALNSWSLRSAFGQNTVFLELQTGEGTGRGGLYAANSGEIGIVNAGAAGWRFRTDASGNAFVTGQVQATSFYQSSLRSLKKNITAFTASGLDVLAKAQVRTFQFKADKTGHTNIGFIADEVPDEMSIPGRTGVDQASTVALLVKSVQELNEQNKVLKDEVKELKALVQQLVNKASQ